jgi:hypothetical protein
VVETVGQLIQNTRNIETDLFGQLLLRFGKLFSRSTIAVEVEETGLTQLHGDIEKVLILFVVEVTDDVRV